MKLNTEIKVCGLTQLQQIDQLIELKIDYLGFIFYEKSPRYALKNLSVNEISKINHHQKVGVFVNEEINKIVETVELAHLNFVQLHGDESIEFIKELKAQLKSTTKLVKVFRINDLNAFIESFNRNEKLLGEHVDYYLFDTDSKAYGGTGKVFDWSILNQLNLSKPYFLSGGISMENIQNINVLEKLPIALDINSKFEIEPGIKNIELIKEFKNSIQS